MMEQVAREYKSLGLSPIPLQMSKAPAALPHGPYLPLWSEYNNAMVNATWKVLQSEHILDEAIPLLDWDRIGVVGGKISGNLEIVDVDCKNHPDRKEFGLRLIAAIEDQMPGFLQTMTVVKTVNDGLHFLYRCDEIEGNQWFAKTPTKEVTIETRGEGGFVVTVPSEGYKLTQGTMESIPTILPWERTKLHEICRSFNEYNEVGYIATASDKDWEYDEDNPFDVFNKKCADEPSVVIEMFEAADWTYVKESGDRVYFLRPGDSKFEHSGDWHKGEQKFKMFSDSTLFEAGKGYNASSSFAILHHNGDKKAAHKALISKGFGKYPDDLQKLYPNSSGLPVPIEELVEDGLTFDFESFWEEDAKGNSKLVIKHAEATAMIGSHYVMLRGYGYMFPKNPDGTVDFTRPMAMTDFIGHVRDAGYKMKQNVLDAMASPKLKKISAVDMFYHLLKTNPWDGVERIKPMIKAMNLKGEKLRNEELITQFLLNTLAFSLRSSMPELANQTVYQRVAMILASNQKSWGKSSFFRHIGMSGLFAKYFRQQDAQINVDLYAEYQGELEADKNKRDTISTNCAMVNFDDVDNMIIGSKGMGSLRSIISQDTVSIRPLYSNALETHNRTCVYVGTTNNEKLLRDRTENRWMVFGMKDKMNFDYFDSDEFEVIQLWAEVHKLFLDGGQINFDAAQLDLVKGMSQDFLYRNDLEDWVAETYIYDNTSILKWEDIAQGTKSHKDGIFGNLRPNEIAKAFQQLLLDGQEHKREENRKVYWNFRLKHPKPTNHQYPPGF